MILRRIAQQLRTQSWTAVGIELVIVVLGVFIGIQLSNWNDDRQTMRRYDRVRPQLVAETERNLTLLGTYRQTWESRLNVVRDAIDILRRCEAGEDQRRRVERGLDAVNSTPTWTRTTRLSVI